MPISSEYGFHYLGQHVKLRYLSDVDIACREGGAVNRFQELPLLERLREMHLTGTYVDVGANIGNHSVFFGLFSAASRVIAMEPHPEIRKVLEKNLLANRLESRVTISRAAAWSHYTELGMGEPVPGNAGRTKIQNYGGHTIEAVPLDDHLGSYTDISLIKFDIEDSEVQALNGSRELIKRNKPVIITEAHNMSFLVKQEEILAPLGYRVADVFEPRNETRLWLPDS